MACTTCQSGVADKISIGRVVFLYLPQTLIAGKLPCVQHMALKHQYVVA